MTRSEQLRQLRLKQRFDLVIIGGGATGLGVAVDAAGRGLSVALLERFDFCKGTSSRSTKLIHGGVRYLAQGNLTLVRDALRERGILARNAPHLVKRLPLVLPLFRWWEGPYYWTGLKAYDLMSGKLGLGHTRRLTAAEVEAQLPGLAPQGLRGGVLFYDGQFDDARLGITLARTAAKLEALVLNYVQVEGLIRRKGVVAGVAARDTLSGEEFEVSARVVVNAAGTGADAVRHMADPGVRPRIALSRGSHVVLPVSCLGGKTALLVPSTDDGRVLFAIPWHGRVVAGTTDIPVEYDEAEPAPADEEVDFILAHLARYLREIPSREQILSVFAGLRPLVAIGGGVPGKTSALSRDHVLELLAGGLISVMGGKWTTYRRMAQDAVDQAVELGGLSQRHSSSAGLKLGGPGAAEEDPLAVYGEEASGLRRLMELDPDWGRPLHPRLPYLMAQVVWGVRHEFAMTVEDVLARRTRSLLLDAVAAAEAAPMVAEVMARELGRDQAWAEAQAREFQTLSARYRV